MADAAVVLSALVIVSCFLLLFRFISRMGIIETQAALRSAHVGQREVPSRRMIGVQNPFTLNLTESHITYTSPEKGWIRLHLSSTVACYVTVYWGVKKETLESAVHEQDEDKWSQDDSDSEELDEKRAVPLEHILTGSYVDRGPSQFYESSSEILVDTEVPADFQTIIQQSTINSHLAVYPLVITVEASVNANSQNDEPFNIVAALGVFLVPSPDTYTFVKDFECVQIADGKMFTIKKLYLTQEAETGHFPDEGMQNSQHHSSTSNTQNSSDFSNSVCVICRSFTVTRALLPCRHACVCGTCFKNISSCPMCRAPIQSFFKVQDEPFIEDTEPNASDELNRMSAWQIIRGIFSAG